MLPKLLVPLALALTGCGLVQVQTKGPPSTEATATAPTTTRVSTAPSRAVTHEGRDANFVSVVDRFNDVGDADAVDLGKIKGVIARATPDMFYTVAACYGPRHFTYLPISLSDADRMADIDFAGIDDSAGTADRPYTTTWTQGGDLRLMSRVPSELASGTPVLVWSVTKTSAIVVTLDGGRYRLDARPYSDGPHFECAGQDGNGKLPPLKALSNGPFPPAVQHQVLSGKQIQALEGAGQLPAGTSKALEDARTAGHACSDRLWQSRFAARDKANTVADILETTRRNRGAAIQSEWQDLIAKQCARQKSAFDAALQSAIQTRAQARLALFNDVSPAVMQRAAR